MIDGVMCVFDGIWWWRLGLALTVKRWVWCDVWCVVCVVNTKQGGCGRCCLNN